MLSRFAELLAVHLLLPRSCNVTSVLTMAPFRNRPLPQRVAVFHAHELRVGGGLAVSIGLAMWLFGYDCVCTPAGGQTREHDKKCR
jgi:hypothetical protein